MWDQVKQALMQSTTRFLTRFASLLPGMVALILALLVSVVLAFILAYVVRRMLTRLRFGERLVQWGFSSPAESRTSNPVLLVSRAIAGLVILVGFLIGITAFDANGPRSLRGAPSPIFPILWLVHWSSWSVSSLPAFLHEVYSSARLT